VINESSVYHKQDANVPVRILLVDFSNLAHGRGPHFSGSAHALARRALARTEMAIIAVRPTHVVFAFDRPHNNTNYEGPPELARLVHMRRIVEDLGYPCHIAPVGETADRLLFALARAYERAGADEVVVCSGDRDLASVVSARTSQLYMRFHRKRPPTFTRRGMPSTRFRQRGSARIVVSPDWHDDWLALSGDIDGVLDGVLVRSWSGIDPANAAHLLERFGSLDSLFASTSAVEPDGLRARLCQIEQSVRERRAAIDTLRDATIDVDFDSGVIGRQVDRPGVHLSDGAGPSFARFLPENIGVADGAQREVQVDRRMSVGVSRPLEAIMTA
jgi:DNA polymerase-1